MHKTKLALIGAGSIGQRHIQAISQVEEAELTAHGFKWDRIWVIVDAEEVKA